MPIIKINGRYLNCFDNGVCIRCGQSDFYPLENHQYYCLSCITLGRISSLDGAQIIAEQDSFSTSRHSYLTNPIELTQQQSTVSEGLIRSFEKLEDHLVWAVTGAGKTEMLFPLIDFGLCAGKRIAIVSPRIDVILELKPRLRAAFAKIDLLTLYSQGDSYRLTNLTLMTSHQLLKFIDAFDLIIVDEVDSFPLNSNLGLVYGIEKAKKQKSSIIYLTATPTVDLKKRVKAGELAVSFLPIRFHQKLLPVPAVKYIDNWEKAINQLKLPKKLLQRIRKFSQNSQRFLLFVPRIEDAIKIYQILQLENLKISGEFVYSSDENRQEKIMKMRNHEIDYLITTTILERGVNLPEVDVLILGADHQIFTENALVQIAGRVGRHVSRPGGLVEFYCQSKTQTIVNAIDQIKSMNQKAVKLMSSAEL